jgi:hypothetical protein
MLIAMWLDIKLGGHWRQRNPGTETFNCLKNREFQGPLISILGFCFGIY